MKLDKRIESVSDIITCFDGDNYRAKYYVGQKGYFANVMLEFKDLESCTYGELENYDIDEVCPFRCKTDDTGHAFFIPEDTLKPKEETKYRPCTIDDFGLHIGDLIKFRKKDDHNFEIGTMYMGYIKYDGIVKVQLGTTYYSFEVLFNNYEWYDSDSNTWEMFGVEE